MVMLEFRLPDADDAYGRALLDLETAFEARLASHPSVSLDGNEVGEDVVRFFFESPDIPTLLDAIRADLQDVKVLPGSFARDLDADEADADVPLAIVP